MTRYAFNLERIRKQREAGQSWPQIAAAYGCDHTTVLHFWRKHNDPVYAAKRAAQTKAWAATRAPRPLSAEQRKRNNLRHEARQEARETGEPVQRIYERWGVA